MYPTLRQLEYAVAIADRGTFSAAAEACFVTQPALSAQIGELERQLGTPLFERRSRGAVPTPAGAAVIERARRILAETAALADVARGLARPLAGPLALGAIPTVAPYLLPRLLPALRERHADLRLSLREEPTARLLASLAAARLDAAVLALPSEVRDLDEEPLFRDAFLLVAPRRHRLARGGSARPLAEEDLDGEEVLLLEDGHCLREQALSVCRAAGARERADFRATSLPTLLQMVAGGSGVTLLPAMAREAEVRARSGLVARPFAPPGPARTIGLVWRASSPRAADFRLLATEMRRAAPPGVQVLAKTAAPASRAPAG